MSCAAISSTTLSSLGENRGMDAARDLLQFVGRVRLLPEHLGSANSAYELLHRHRYPDAGLRDACDRRLSGE
jgi:hypothetical protein